MSYLAQECERYHLEMCSFPFIDVQIIGQKATASPTPENLEKACERYEVDTSGLVFHKSCDDAEISGLFLQAIAHRLGFSLADTLAYFPSAASDVTTSLAEEDEKRKHHPYKRHLCLPKGPNDQQKEDRLAKWMAFKDQMVIPGPLNGAVYSLSFLVREDLDASLSLCERIAGLGGKLTKPLHEGDHLIVYDEGEKAFDSARFADLHLQFLTLKEAKSFSKANPKTK